MTKTSEMILYRTLALIAVLGACVFAVPTEAQIEVLNVAITTANKFAASTNDDVVLELLVAPVDSNGELEKREWRFENDGDLFERGDTNRFQLTENLPQWPCEIVSIRVRKQEVNLDGGWYFGGLQLYYNDEEALEIYRAAGLEVWMRGDDVDWSPSDYPPEDAECPEELFLGDPPPTPDIPLDCYVEVIDDLPIQYPDSDCDGVADHLDAEPDTPGPDSDEDGIPDAREEIMGTDPDDPDTDGDGIPDAHEDLDRDGIVDPGETDPNNPDTDGNGVVDGDEDSDEDGLPDWYEVDTDPGDDDSDDDGWVDGPRNLRTFLILRQIDCENEKEDFGHDEFFLVVDDVRFPVDSQDIDGRYRLEKGDVVNPDVIVGRRVRSPSQEADYMAVVEMWEDDSSDSVDDHWQTDRVSFGESGEVTIDRNVSSFLDRTIYHVTFLTYSRPFRDPHPVHADGVEADAEDADGLWDGEEHALSGELGGLSDPAHPDIFLEMDWVGSEQQPEPWSKRDVVSQFHYHDFALHLDDGDFQHLDPSYGGENLSYSGAVHLRESRGSPSVEEIAITDGHLAESRRSTALGRGLFHYILAVDEVAGDRQYGWSATVSLNDDGEIVCGCGSRTGLSVFRSDYYDASFDGEAIFFMHELGHDFGLCHRPEDNGNTVVPAPLCVGLTPTDCEACRSCSHYWVDQDSITAMGGWAGFNGWYAVIGAVGAAIVVGLLGAAIGSIWGPVGVGIGAAAGFVLGALGGVFAGGYAGDLIARDVMYTAAEWGVLNLRAVRCW